jgi:large subunit ribosomal protein L10
MDRAQKAELAAHFREVFSTTTVVVVTRYSGLTVAEMTSLRNKMREAGADFKVVKNRVTRLALEGTSCAPIADLLTSPTAIGYSNDPVAAPKVLAEFAKSNDKLVLVGGVMGGTVLDVDGVKALATLPSLDVLRARLLGMIQTPATRLASLTQAPAAQIARVLGAYAAQGEAA